MSKTALINVDVLLQRQHILDKLKEIAELLESYGTSHNIGDPKRLQFLKGSIYCYSVLLHGLRDTEMDSLHLRLQRLEEVYRVGS